MKAQLPVLVDRAAQSRSRRLYRGRRDHRDLAFDTGDAAQMLLYERRLPVALRVGRRVLKVAPSTPSWLRVTTGWRDTFRARLEYVNGVTAIKAGRSLGDGDADEFTRQRVSHECDTTVVRPTDGSPRRGTIHANC